MHIAEVAHALMSEKNMPPCYWAEATSIAVYTMNRTPTAAVHDMTPKERFTGKKPNVSHFKVFGCIAYVHVPDELRTKLDPIDEKCAFIGYSLEQKGYKCYNPITRQVRVSRDVVFDEMATWYADVKDDIWADVNKSVAKNLDARSQVLSGPQGSPASSHVANPWSGRLRKEVSPASSINVSRKGKEKVDEGMRMHNVTAGHDDNQEPATTTASTSDSPTLNTLNALQEELQQEKLQRELIVFGMMAQTVAHGVKVRELEQQAAQAKAELEAQKIVNETLIKEKEAVDAQA
ncbi:hypothetical protein L7F22_024373 [Adiantum nelumboides]|nr:hypothetical protein [Adiantum nelumboides]